MRFRQRHVHQTIYRFVTDGLADLGWMGTLIPQAPPNFGTDQVVVIDYEPQKAGVTPAPNTVAVSIEHQGMDNPFELGGLEVVEYTLFIDVYPVNEPIGIAIADDVKDLLTNHSLPVKDYTSDPSGEDTDLWLEFEDIVVDDLTSTGAIDKRAWRAVKATACCYF